MQPLGGRENKIRFLQDNEEEEVMKEGRLGTFREEEWGYGGKKGEKITAAQLIGGGSSWRNNPAVLLHEFLSVEAALYTFINTTVFYD